MTLSTWQKKFMKKKWKWNSKQSIIILRGECKRVLSASLYNSTWNPIALGLSINNVLPLIKSKKKLRCVYNITTGYRYWMCSFDAIKKDVKITIKHHGAMPIVEMDRPAYWVQYLYKPEPNTAARSVFLFKAFKYHIQRSKWVWTFTCHRHNN